MVEFCAVDKTQIANVLLTGGLLGIVRDEFQEHIVSEYWWYDPWDRSCHSSKSRDPGEKPDRHTVSEATDHLWLERGRLWICGKAADFVSRRNRKV